MDPFFDCLGNQDGALGGVISQQSPGKGLKLLIQMSEPGNVGSFSSGAENLSCPGSASPSSGPWSTGPLTPSEAGSSYMPIFDINQGNFLNPENTQYYPPSSPSVSIYEASENEDRDNYSLLHPTFISDAIGGGSISDSNLDTSLVIAGLRHHRLDLREDSDSLFSSLIRSVQGGFQCGLPNCVTPGETFPTQDAVILHIRTQDAASETGRFACACKKRFVSKDIATRHVRTQNYGKVFKCPVDVCSHRFKREDQINAHVRAKHPGHPLPKRRKRKKLEGSEIGSLTPLSSA